MVDLLVRRKAVQMAEMWVVMKDWSLVVLVVMWVA
jgi:hypothetical protein